MTHDLFVALMHAYGLQLVEAFIYKFEDGIFSSELTFLDSEGKEVQLDARTSDSIAIAVRSGAPIFTTRTILNETGFTMETMGGDNNGNDTDRSSSNDDEEQSIHARIKALREALAKAIEDEAYEEASRLSREIAALEASKD